ncbi:GDT1-like protein 1 [Durusdinium trenchii]|uniref:Chloroplastic n=1 Tax=Durusdinium trenchii TaxID=1381693 RepID=A0ABP0S3N2_9DINO
MSASNGKPSSEGSKEQASQALRQLFRSNGLAKSGDVSGHPEIDVKLAALLDRVLKVPGDASGSSSTPKSSAARMETWRTESPEELAEKMGPEPVRKPLPELPKKRLVLPEEGGLSAPMKVRVKNACEALEKKDKTVTQLTLNLKQCRKEVWKLQCEANAADMKVARLLQKREGELPEEYREELERLKDKEEALADQLSHARANAQRWASVAKRQDAMLQQEREEQRGDAHSILAKHPAGEVFWSQESDSESEEERRRPGPSEVTLGSSDEESPRGSYPAAKGKSRPRSYSSDSASSGDSLGLDGPTSTAAAVTAKAVPPLPELSKTQKLQEDADEGASSISGDSLDLPGTGPTPTTTAVTAKAVPPLAQLPKTQRLPEDDEDEIYSEIESDIQESSRSV